MMRRQFREYVVRGNQYLTFKSFSAKQRSWDGTPKKNIVVSS